MDGTFQKLLSLGLGLERVGLMQCEDNGGYFCTPRDAFLLGWAGVDGIHYCQVPGLGETVFVVDPMDGGDSPVHPIARNVTDMLRLLLACGDMAAPAQAHAFPTKQSFGEFLTKCRPDAEAREVLEAIGRGLDIKPMPLPYKYIKELQGSFDMGSVPYTEEYYEVVGRGVLTVRKSGMNDIGVLRELYHELEADAVKYQPEHFVFGDRDDKFFMDIFESGTQDILVAEVDGSVAGFAHLMILRQKDVPCLKPQTVVYVQDIAVFSHMRGQGIGTKLIESSKEYGLAHGADFIRAQVFPQKEDGLRFYERCGFLETMKTVEAGIGE